jgi:predicted nucleic acid-binding Zn ribbon protein
VQSVLAKLSLCRTRALGGKTYQCDDCGETTDVYHSCGDRHCPQCSGCKRYDFATRAEQLILAGVTYYQTVFTLPGDLSELALANREAMADLLFMSAAKSLHKTIRLQQGYDPASMMVLHTWNQQLQPHWHVHALVPGGGPSLTSDQWKSAQSPPGAVNSDDYYLVDAISLRETYRKFAIAHLRRLYKKGMLKLGRKFAHLQDEQAWERFCDELAAMDWVSFIQPPPTASCTADQVVRYLTRYLTGGPISDSRILSADANQVTFLAREGKRVGGERAQVPVTLATLEFVRRWCDHIQPDQLTKTRYFGGWCNQRRAEYQADCRRLLGAAPETVVGPTEPASSPTGSLLERSSPEGCCPQCQACQSGSLRLVAETAKPSWSSVLTHRDTRCPQWYAELEHAALCEQLEREYGVGYEDWCLEMRIESPMSARPVSVVQQPYLPSLWPVHDFTLESF